MPAVLLSARQSTSPEQKREHRKFLVILFFMSLAAAHAVWAASWLVDDFRVSKDIYSGFRLLGSPNLGITQSLVHVDFVVFLVGIVWLVNYRWTFQRPSVIEQDSVSWTPGHVVGLVSVLALGAGLLLWNVGGPVMWQDEAQSALISRTVVETGLPRGTDGLNYFSQESGAEYADGYLWRWHTWLPFYMVAGSYEILGDNTFASRFPSVLLGWISICLTYQLGVELWRDRRSALLGAGVLTICVGFLLLSRQCRYYSALMCFTLMSVMGYWRLMQSQRGGYWLLISGMTMLFHSHYVYTAICGAAFIAHCTMLFRQRMKPLMIAAAWVVVLALPWVVWFLQMRYGSRYGGRTLLPELWFNDFSQFVQHVALEFIPWMLWPIPFLLVQFREKHSIPSAEQPRHEVGVLFAILIVAHLVMLSPIVPYAFFRYIAPLAPLTALIVGRWIVQAYRMHKALAAWMVAVIVLSWPGADFVREQVVPVQDAGGAIVKYLRTHSQPEDVILTNIGDLPLKYYLPNRVVGGLAGENLDHITNPEWVILRQHARYIPQALKTKIEELTQSDQYEPIVIPVPDTPFEHREEPCGHLFATDWNEPLVVIYRRRLSAAKVTQR